MNHRNYILKVDSIGQLLIVLGVILLVYFSVIEALKSIQILVIMLAGLTLALIFRTIEFTYTYDYQAILYGLIAVLGVSLSGIATFILAQAISSTYYLVLIAIAEEILVRGFMLPVFARYSNPYLGIVASSVVWSVYHIVTANLETTYFIYILLSGLVYGYIDVYTRSLTPSLLAHTLINYIAGLRL